MADEGAATTGHEGAATAGGGGQDRGRRVTLIAEDLLLLLLDDEEGRADLRVRAGMDIGLAGAILAELSLAGVIDLADPKGRFKAGEVTVTDAGAVTDPVLRDAVATISEKGRSVQSVVFKLTKGLRERLLERLAAAGMVERQQDRFLLVFERTRWPAVDASHEAEVREAIEAALFDGTPPDGRTGVLIALLSEGGQVHRIFRRDGVGDDAVKARAKEIADGGWASEAVRKALAAAAVPGALTGAGVI